MIPSTKRANVPMGTILVLSLVTLGITGWASSVIFDRTNDPNLLIDVDWAGNHFCPAKTDSALSRPLPLQSDRPNENELWLNRIQSYGTRLTALKLTHEIEPEILAEIAKGYDSELAQLKANEQHYRIEARRTVLEMENDHPLSIRTLGQGGSVDEIVGVPVLGSTCYLVFPQFNHFCARIDVLEWYAKRGRFPKNSTHRALTPSSTRTPPALPSALSQLLASSAPLSASVQAGPVSFIVRHTRLFPFGIGV